VVVDWRKRAACATDGEPEDRLWFPECVGHRGRDAAAWLAAARATCDGCPVQVECLLDALRMPAVQDQIGIRGGLTPAERDELRADAWASGEVLPAARQLIVGGAPDGERAAKVYRGERATHRRGRSLEEWQTRNMGRRNADP
jgi:hypothetical protein